MAVVGYARVSSVGQRLDVQVAKLQHCDKLFQEHTSGSAAQRPGLAGPSGELPAVRFGRSYRVPESAVTEALQRPIADVG